MLTEKQIAMLKAVGECPRDSWGFGAATVSSLRKLGFIEARKVTLNEDTLTMNYITDAGRAALAGGK